MKLFSIAALALITATPAFAGAPFLVDFEKNWDYGVDVNTYYSGGTAADGTSGSCGFKSDPDGASFNSPGALPHTTGFNSRRTQ